MLIWRFTPSGHVESFLISRHFPPLKRAIPLTFRAPDLVKSPPAKTFVWKLASARTSPFSPAPRLCQELPVHLATFFAFTDPAELKRPPT